jgi:antirestriction protein ArdC
MTRDEYKNHVLSLLGKIGDAESERDAAVVEEWFSKSNEELKSILQAAALVIGASDYLANWSAMGSLAARLAGESVKYIPEWVSVEVKTVIVPGDEKVH